MAIRQIPHITIDGRNSAFGGYIYNLDYQPSFSSAPSKLTIHFINESGTYFPPSLMTALSTPYLIRAGDELSLTMYAYKYRYSKSPTGKVLIVEFLDGSFSLDKKWVGLYKHYASATGIYGSVLVVGQEFHPCDLNKDGKVDYADRVIYENLPLNVCTNDSTIPSGGIAMNSGDSLHNPYLDPVPPSGLPPTGSGQFVVGPSGDIFSITNFCGANYSMKIFDMGYNFDQLLSAMESAGIGVWKPSTGALSGNNHFPASNSGYFLRESGPLRESLKRFCGDYGYDFFWDDGRVHFVDVKTPISLDFLDESSIKNASNWTEEVSLEGTTRRGHATYYEKEGEWAENSCSSSFLQYLNPITLNIIFNEASLTDKRLDPYGLGSLISLNLFLSSACMAKYGDVARAFFWLLFVGDGDVSSPNGMWNGAQAEGLLNAPINEYGKFTIERVFLPVAGHGLTEYNKIMGLDPAQDKYDFYVVASFDESLAKQQHELDDRFSDFFGKYYYDTWIAAPCGSKPAYTAEPDAKADLVTTPTDINLFENGNPFLNKNYKFSLSRGVVVTRSPKWSPSPKSADVMVPLAGVEKLLPHKIVINDKTLRDSLGLTDNKILYGCYDFGQPTFAITPVSNPSELATDTTPSFGRVGLRDATKAFNISFTVPSQFNLSFVTPCNIFDNNNLRSYKVISQGSNSAKFPVKKIQDAVMSETDAGMETLNFAINHIDLSDADIRLLAWDSSTRCKPLEDIVASGHSALNKLMSFDVTVPHREISFDVPGIGISGVSGRIYPSLASGLVSLKISLDGNGIKTSYAFSNRPKTLPSVELMKHTLFTRTKLPSKVLP